MAPPPRPLTRALRLALFGLALLTGPPGSGAASCSGRCGGVAGAPLRRGSPSPRCSCRPSCLRLGTCCPDYGVSCPDLWPSSGTLLGGRDLALLQVALSGPAAAAASVRCRFGGSVETEGYVAEDGGVHCVSPLLYQLGSLPLEVSPDGGRTFPWTAAWTAVHHNKVPPSEKSTLVNETKWQYYGTPGTEGNLTLAWDPRALAAPRLNIEVWGYRETGEPYSSNWTGEWRYLYSLTRNHPNSGSFSFLPAPSALHGGWELGALRISSSVASEGQSNVAAIWSTEHALAWHLGDGFQQDSAAWATAKCHQWDARETGLPSFLEEIPDCPCSLAQARADTGRFHTDYGCDIEKGSVCTYHPGAVHCVRGIQASPRYAAGQQCCYDATGTQVLTGDSIGGSTPDRGHDWGSPPYQKPPRVPGFSHWLYDVLSFYYCCLWSQNCPIYFKHRPSSGCQRYRPPRAASAFGDPHLITFDSTNFTFKGLGEYTLLESSLTLLKVQGRTRPAMLPAGVEAKVTGFSAIAMQENSSDVVEIRIQEHSDQLEILLNQKPLNFSEQTWMDLKGLFLSATPGKKATVMFSSGAGAEVSSQPGRVLSVTLLLPEEFLNHTQGLFGMMNGDPRDDLAFRNGTTLDASRSSPEQLLAFGADWAIRNESSLFTYDTQDLLVTFFYGPKHNSSFVPEFSPSEDPSDPLVLEMAVLCQSDPFCRFDVLTTRDLAVGNGTRLSHLSYRHLKERLQPVVSCSWVAPPMNGSKNGTNYLAGSTVHFRCDPGFSLAGSTARVCQDNGIWSGLPASCLPNIGTRWAPGPFASAPCIVLSFLSLAVALGTMA